MKMKLNPLKIRRGDRARSRQSTIGLPPGTPVYLGVERAEEITVEIFQYNDENAKHRTDIDPEDFVQDYTKFVDKDHVTWINIDGIYDNKIVKYVGEQFSLHPLTIEDIMNSDHRPKVEYFEDYVHFTLKMLSFNQEKKCINSEQISFVLGRNYVISFQETPGDIFDPIRDRIKNNKGRICRRKADFLVYSLIDVIVDNYFLITDELQIEIEELEQKVIAGGEKEELESLLKLKKDVAFMRKSVVPVREAISALNVSDSNLIEKNTKQFLRDVYDHTIHISDAIENHREMLQSLLDIYLTGLSNRMNNVMKTLTIISTVFIPLTFIAGLLGMNFEDIPLGHHPYGFWLSTGVMVGVAIIMIIILRNKKWF